MGTLLTEKEWLAVLPTIKYVLSDCDGVLWNGDRAIDGSRECLEKLRKLGKEVFYVTNNSTKTREDGVNHCHKLKFQAQLNDIYSTAYATGAFLKNKGVKSIYLIGSRALWQEITSQGISCNEQGPDKTDAEWDSLKNIDLGDPVEAVVIGYDPHFSMSKVCRAASYLLNPKCLFIGTNEDQTLPTDRKDIAVPGTGCVVSSVQTASGRQPTIIGKPHPTLIELLRNDHPDITPQNALFIGDRLNTDIELGRRQGFRTLLVESGVHKRTDIDPEKAPTYYLPSLGDLLKFMK
ncbi:phosphoglycolate phosphatase-like [Tropilaelaps mercedesae]|uniref:Phosphoglycolate phosphatase-like n=1 Tax=Tropilaelaps mercedesae TaxID=418985 RepID=A0A1V9Y0K9_9ACAR|nr:phosphoglycolate phosphatase-like [Tropilaelaps mercedesae]